MMTTKNKKTIAASLIVLKALSPLSDDAPDLTMDTLTEMVEAHESKFTFADAERLTRESATWPLPTFEGGPGAAARRAIAASEAERLVRSPKSGVRSQQQIIRWR